MARHDGLDRKCAQVFQRSLPARQVAVLDVGNALPVEQAAGEQRMCAHVEHRNVTGTGRLIEIQHAHGPADQVEFVRVIELQIGLEHRRALHLLFSQHASQRLEARLAARGHQLRCFAVHRDRDAALAISRGAEQELLARVCDQHAPYRLVRDASDFCQQRLAVAIGRTGVDGKHAALAHDEARVAEPPARNVVDFTRNALHHVDAARDLDCMRRIVAVRDIRRRAPRRREDRGNAEQPGKFKRPKHGGRGYQAAGACACLARVSVHVIRTARPASRPCRFPPRRDSVCEL